MIERGEDHLAGKVVALPVPESLPAVSGREHDGEVELRLAKVRMVMVDGRVVVRDGQLGLPRPAISPYQPKSL